MLCPDFHHLFMDPPAWLIREQQHSIDGFWWFCKAVTPHEGLQVFFGADEHHIFVFPGFQILEAGGGFTRADALVKPWNDGGGIVGFGQGFFFMKQMHKYSFRAGTGDGSLFRIQKI